MEAVADILDLYIFQSPQKVFIMVRGQVAAALVAISTLPAMACVEAAEATHQREIALLDKSIQTFKREPALIAKAKALRDQADTAFKARQFNLAWKDRRRALLLIGYSVGHAPAQRIAAIATGPTLPAQDASKAVSTGATGCSGGAPYWDPPADAGR